MTPEHSAVNLQGWVISASNRTRCTHGSWPRSITRARRVEFLLLRNADTTGDQRGLDGVAAFLRRIVSTDRLTIAASTRRPGPLHEAAHVTVTLEDRSARVVVA